MITLTVICEITQLLSGMAFPILVISYLGYMPPFLEDFTPLQGIVKSPVMLLSLCLLFTILFTAANILKNVIVARVTSNREAWYAERIRARRDKNINKKDVARGSHYYGRLAGTVIQVPGPALITVLGYLAIYFFVPLKTGLLILAVSAIAAPVLILIILLIGRLLKASIESILRDAREVALWKYSADIATRPVIMSYYKSYFYRIFLVGVFGYAGTVFSVVFVFLLLLNELIGWRTANAHTIFILFIVGRLYLATLTGAVSNIIKTAAFLPSVDRVFKEVDKP